jgi:hypothetical protein
MPLKKFTSRLSLLKIEEQAPFWWNEAKLALCCALIHKPKFYFLMNLLGVDPFPEKFWDMLKDCNKRDYDIGLHALHG